MENRTDNKFDRNLQSPQKWFEGLLKLESTPFETLIVDGLKLVQATKGFVLFNFIVSDLISDAEGNWHVGAMAALIDGVGAATVLYHTGGHAQVSVDLNISFYSTAKIGEEVEIEARVVGDRRKIISALIQVRKKNNGELVALGKLWMASTNNYFRGLSKL